MWVQECFQSLFDLSCTWAMDFFLIQVRNSEIATNSTGQKNHNLENTRCKTLRAFILLNAANLYFWVSTSPKLQEDILKFQTEVHHIPQSTHKTSICECRWQQGQNQYFWQKECHCHIHNFKTETSRTTWEDAGCPKEQTRKERLDWHLSWSSTHPPHPAGNLKIKLSRANF